MKIELLTEEYSKAFESFVRSQSPAMMYYGLKYREFLQELLTCEAKYYLALEGEKVKGVLPLMFKQGAFGTVMNSLPFYGSNGGILAENEEAKSLLLEQYVSELNSGTVAAATLVDNPLDQNYAYDRIITQESDYRIGQLTKIEGSYQELEDLMRVFHYKTRNTIRKSAKLGVTIEVENDGFDFLQETHEENMRSIGGMAKPGAFFELVQKHFKPDTDYRLYVARHKGTPVAAMLVFYFNQVVEYYMPVVVKDFRNLQALSLTIARAMFDAAASGYVWWNWGGTWTDQKGVHQFKSRWGTSDINYRYHISIVNEDLRNATKEQLLSEYPGFYVLPFDILKSAL